MRAVFIAVGDELLGGRVLNRHAAHASQQLDLIGIETTTHLTVGDAPGELAGWLRQLAPDADLVLLTGGLGPTEDDRTRDEVAAAAGVGTEFREKSWERIRERYGDRLRSPERNRRQAYFPVGAEEVDNRFGTAPAFVMPGGSKSVPSRLGWWALPGVPREFEGLLRDTVLPRLRADCPAGPPIDVFRFFGISESVLDGWLVAQIPADQRDRYHVCVSDGEIEIRAPVALELEVRLQAEFGDRFLGRGAERLPARLVERARSTHQRIAVAESCTGGGVAARIVDVPGASDCFDRGWVTYSNRSKTEELGVPPQLIEAHGAVSEEVASSMAEGARMSADADVSVSVTGIAGPGGGTADKPAGTTWIGTARRGVEPAAHRLVLPGDRERVRTLAAEHALFALYRLLAAR